MPLEYEFVTSARRLAGVARKVRRADVVGLDIETTSLDPRYGDIRLIQLNVPGEANEGRGEIFVIDLFKTGEPEVLLKAIKKTDAIFVIHNAKFEQKWFWWHYRIRLWPIFCTFRASALVYNGKKGLRNDLDTVVRRELSESPVHTGQGESDWSGTLTQEQKDYAAEDVLRLPKLREALRKHLVDYSLLHTALIEFGVVWAEGRVELNGFPLNRDSWMALADANASERLRLREELLSELPHPKGQIGLPGLTPSWNIDSPQQMLASLRKLGLDIEKTPEIVLAQHAAKFPLVKKILDYRHVAQRVKTFGEKYLRHVDEHTGRVHSDYYGLLVTGRYASSNPNLQQIPRGADFRACFRAPDGRMFVLADYSGIEMRLCAEISGDLALIAVFARGEDAHRATAAIIMAVDPDSVTKKQRQHAKPVNFGFIYGMMPDKLVLYAMANYGVAMTPTEAKKYRERYFESYPGIGRWHQRVLRDGKRQGLSRTLSGRVRYLDPNENYNEFFNTPVQGSGADALKTSMAIVQDRVDDTFGVTPAKQPDGPVQMVHHVHDEIILETDDDPEMIEVSEKLLNDGMIEGMQKFMKRVPTVVEPSHGPTWSDAK